LNPALRENFTFFAKKTPFFGAKKIERGILARLASDKLGRVLLPDDNKSSEANQRREGSLAQKNL
jgi:hypothetical protein